MDGAARRGRQCLTLEDGEYVEQADVTREQERTATEPFPVTVRPSELVR